MPDTLFNQSIIVYNEPGFTRLMDSLIAERGEMNGLSLSGATEGPAQYPCLVYTWLNEDTPEEPLFHPLVCYMDQARALVAAAVDEPVNVPPKADWFDEPCYFWKQLDPKGYDRTKEINPLWANDGAWRVTCIPKTMFMPEQYELRQYLCNDFSSSMRFMGQVFIKDLDDFIARMQALREALRRGKQIPED